MEPYKLPACAENDLVKSSHNMTQGAEESYLTVFLVKFIVQL